MKHLFIINPTAGKGNSLKLIPDINRIFSEKDEEFIIEVTERPGHASEIAKYYSEKDTYRIYSVGGDGTLNEVLTGMINSKSSLAIIPTGSGNDFIRSITHNYVDDILFRTIDGKEELIDLGTANGRYFVNISSAGIDAEVVNNAAKLRKLPGISGSLSYMLSALITIFFMFKSYSLKIEIDGKHYDKKSLLVAVANGKYYGGGMLPTPDAQINDGKFDICVASKMNRFKVLSFFPKFIKGKHTHLKEVNLYRGSKVSIRCDKGIMANIDGEVGKVKEIVFEIVPKAITVVIPLNS